MDLVQVGVNVATDPKHSRLVSNCLIAAEAVLCGLIVWKVPYTEIDWKTYMQQVSLFLNDGITDYAQLKGDTGPLVYPALHVYLYSVLYYVTDHGTNVLLAQCAFALLYLVTLAVVLACYRRVGAPPWLLVLLCTSKRMHSLFLLRLFNDAWAAMLFWVSVWMLQRRFWAPGGIAWCLGVGVKMTLVLAAPALGVILVQGAGVGDGIIIGLLMPLMQMSISFPFISPETGFDYFRRAFDFGRQFLFKWTVNWRFVGEDVFTSPAFAYTLLLLHGSFILVFLQTRWVNPSSSDIAEFVRKYTQRMHEKMELAISQRVTATFVMDSMLGSMVIGMLCARSLHYQFFAYLGWATPYLLWRSGLGPTWVVLNWTWQEWAWLMYPSTRTSSIMVVVEMALATASVWWGSRDQAKAAPSNGDDQKGRSQGQDLGTELLHD